MATTTEPKAAPEPKQPDIPKGGAAVLEGLGSIFSRGSLSNVIGKIKKAEDLMRGERVGAERKKQVVNALTYEVTKRAPSLKGAPTLTALLGALVQMTFDEMKANGEVSAESGE